MPEEQFIREINHRSNLLIESFNPRKAINWVRKMNNRHRILCLQEETRKYLSGEFTSQEVSEFWWRLDDSDTKEFIFCLGAGARVLCRRGKMGDIYSIPVLHCVVTHFIQHYLCCALEKIPETEE